MHPKFDKKKTKNSVLQYRFVLKGMSVIVAVGYAIVYALRGQDIFILLYFKFKIRLPSNNIYFTVSLQLSSYILTKLILLTKLSILFQSSIIILNSTWVHSQTCFTTFLAGCAQQRQHFKWNLLVFCLISLFWFWGQGKDTYLS